jgi:aminoglycoside phosphotransferase (APT) family kinase protein
MTRGIPAAEVDVNAALVKELLREQHVDLAELPIAALEVGWDNVMFRLGAGLTVRLPRRAASAALLEREQAWLPILAPGLSLPVPVPLRVGRPSSHFPWHWSVLPWLPGEPMFRVAPSREQARVFARFLRELHQLAPSNAPESEARGVPLQQRAAALQECIERLRIDEHVITPSIDAAWRRALAANAATERCWLHGDLHALNVLVNGNRISAVVDWGDLTAGDVATDLACAWTLFAEPAARRELLEEYNPSDALLTRALGWAVAFGVLLLDAGLVNSPLLAELGRTTLARVDHDLIAG